MAVALWIFMALAPNHLWYAAYFSQLYPYGEREYASGCVNSSGRTIPKFGNPWRERFYTRAPTTGRTQYHEEVKKEVFSTVEKQYQTFMMVTNNFEICYLDIC